MNIPLFYKCFESCYFLLCMMKTWKSDVLKKILSVRIKKQTVPFLSGQSVERSYFVNCSDNNAGISSR